MASKGNNCSLSIPLSARPDTTTQTNLWPRPFRIAVRALRALAPSVISSPATGSLSLCIFLYFLPSLSLSFLIISPLLLLFLLLPRSFSCLEDWEDRGGAVLLLLFLFFDRSMLFSWLGSGQREEDWTAWAGEPSIIIIIIIIFTFLGPGQREEDWTGRGKPSIIVINIIIFTFHVFLNSGQREDWTDRIRRIDDATTLVARILESAKYHRLESLC